MCAFQSIDIEIELLADVSVSASNRTLGEAETLTCLLGRTLWGLAANQAYAAGMDENEAFRLFHQGAVRFTDAVPLQAGARTYPVPRSWHQVKHGNPSETIYNMVRDAAPADVQLKPLAEGWLTPACEQVPVETAYSLRTSVDRSGKARSGLLFGIPVIMAGTRFCASISGEAVDVERVLAGLLASEVSLGRSRHTELGQVRIRRAAEPIAKLNQALEVVDGTLSFLCVSRLILRDPQTGFPTVTPTPQAFGLDASWHWDARASFIRSTRIVHFNGKRGRPETERHAIERGSVITFRGGQAPQSWEAWVASLTAGVGEATGQGYGEVLLNPAWLNEAQHELQRAARPREASPAPQDELFTWARNEATRRRALGDAYVAAREAALKFSRYGVPASQWGTIHQMARAASARGQSTDAFAADLNEYLSDGKRNVSIYWKTGARQALLDLLKRPDAPRFVEHLANACMRQTHEATGGARS